MSRDMIVLEGNVCDGEVPLRVLFLYRGLPEVKDELGTVVVLTPQYTLADEDKELLEDGELLELDAGTLAAEVRTVDKPAGVVDRTALKAYTVHLQYFYRVYRERFLQSMQNTYSLRGLVIDATKPGGGIEVAVAEAL